MGSLADQIKAAQAAKAARQEAKLQEDRSATPPAQSRPVERADDHSVKVKQDAGQKEAERPSSPSQENSSVTIQSVAANIALAKKRREEKEAAEKLERERVAAEKEEAQRVEKERKAAALKALEEKRATEKALADKAEEDRRAANAAQKALEEQRAAEKAEKAAKKEAEKKAAEERAAAEKENMHRQAMERLVAERAKQALAGDVCRQFS